MQEKNLGRPSDANKSRPQMAIEALESCSECIETISTGILTVCRLYQEGQGVEAGRKFSEVVELIDLFVQLIAQVQRTLRSLGRMESKNSELQALEMHLLGILKALIPAKEKGDVVMLCDLLEYELVDNLSQWKIKAIPEMKALTQAPGPGRSRP